MHKSGPLSHPTRSIQRETLADKFFAAEPEGVGMGGVDGVGPHAAQSINGQNEQESYSPLRGKVRVSLEFTN